LPGNSNRSGARGFSQQSQSDLNRTTGTEIGNGRGGASLGVNVVASDDGQGVVVARTRPGTPADQMGLRPSDRILKLNGQPVGSVEEFIGAIRAMNVGDQVELSIDRGGNAQNLAGRLEALRDRLASGEGPVGNAINRARDFVREQGDRINDSRDSRQASYEEGISGRSSSDLEARLTRLEQQMERLTRELEQLRTSPGSLQPSIGTQPSATGIGTTGLRDSGTSFPVSTPGTTPTIPGSTTTPSTTPSTR